MKQVKYTRIQCLLVYLLLFISFFLQSCGNFSNYIAPKGNEIIDSTQELTQKIYSQHLVGKEFMTEGNNLVTFYEQNGKLKGDVMVDRGQLAPTYTGLSVQIASGISDVDLVQLSYLGRTAQKRLIHVYVPKNGQERTIILMKGGLQGGMMQEDASKDKDIPNECFCPITQEVMEDPVSTQDGHTYERAAIQRWFSMGNRTSPKTGARLLSTELIPNYTLRSLIQDLKKRIPVLDRHQVDMNVVEIAVKLLEEEMQQKLELKGNLLQQEQQKVTDLEKQLKELKLQQQPFEEVVIILGNIGSGKSTICNTILQKAVFGTIIDVNNNNNNNNNEPDITQEIYVIDKKLYIKINTPRLSDGAEKWKQAAETIEKSLQHNNNYKIVFVITLESGKLKPEDFLAISTVSNTINAPFEYGLILNKATQITMEDIFRRGLESYLAPLKHKPYASVILKMEDENSKEGKKDFSLNSEHKSKLADFLSKLQGVSILKKDVKAIDVVGLQEKSKALKQISEDEIKEDKGNKQLPIDIENYFTRHASKKNINWEGLVLPQELYSRSKFKQAEAVARVYKDLLYDKNTKYGGWLLLSKTCYLRNEFKKLLSPEQMGLTIIEPKCFKDKRYEKQLIRYLRDGVLSLVSVEGNTINPPYVEMTLQNNSNEDIDFTVEKGQVFEVSRFKKVQNLAISKIVKTKKDSYGNILPFEKWELEAEYENSDTMVSTIKAKSQATISYLCRCINPNNASPDKEQMNPTSLIKNQAAKEIKENPKATEPVQISGENDNGSIYDNS